MRTSFITFYTIYYDQVDLLRFFLFAQEKTLGYLISQHEIMRQQQKNIGTLWLRTSFYFYFWGTNEGYIRLNRI